jgi:hypothetical protein
MAFKHKTDTVHYHDTVAEARACDESVFALCAHGMARNNCFGPQHYMYDSDEQAAGLVNEGPVMDAPPAVTTINHGNYGGCEGGKCSWHDKCHKHRVQDARNAGTHWGSVRAMFRAYND